MTRMATLKLAVIGMLLMGGCAPGPVLRVTTSMYNLGDNELEEGMTKVNLIGMVGVDEEYAGALSRYNRNVLYMAGAAEGDVEFRYRIARINLRHLKGFLFIRDGSQLFTTAAMVPDNMPALKAWDIVEVRQTATYDVLKGFAKTNEGNAVLRVLCRKSSPGYEACADALPRIGSFRAQGYTGAPYLPTLKEYGLKFSEAYTETGAPLRPLPH